jgi:hypothetical protein
MIIALDLEGTLISNAMSQFPRPGLYHFLEFCRNNFQRVVLFTAVSESRTKNIVQILVESGDAPSWFAEDVEYTKWEGQYKDLRFIENAGTHEILLVDDQEAYIHPEQMECWIRIPEFEPPYSESDDALSKLKEILTLRLNQATSEA